MHRRDDRDVQVTIDEFDFADSAGGPGLWSYPAAANKNEVETRSDGFTGLFRYPGCQSAYLMNTGIRNRDAESGALIMGTDLQSGAATVSAIRQTLRDARPFGSTPVAAALDDLRWMFADDPELSAELREPLRERHLILISDGRPDDDYRNAGCDCFAT